MISQMDNYERIRDLEETIESIRRTIVHGLRSQVMRGDRSGSDVFMIALKLSDKIEDMCVTALGNNDKSIENAVREVGYSREHRSLVRGAIV